jgi:hypothetical protein
MALDLGREPKQVGVQFEHVIRRHQAGHHGGGRRSQASRKRDLRAQRELELVGRMEPLERAHAQVFAVTAHRQLGVDPKAPGLRHLDLQVQSQRGGHHVKAGPEVG